MDEQYLIYGFGITLAIIAFFVRKLINDIEINKNHAETNITLIKEAVAELRNETKHNKNLLEVSFSKDINTIEKVFETKFSYMDSKLDTLKLSIDKMYEEIKKGGHNGNL